MLFISWMTAVLPLWSNTVSMADADPNLCFNETYLNQAYLDCFRNARVEGILSLPAPTVASIVFFPLELICSQMDQILGGAMCGLELERVCTGEDYVPTNDAIAIAFNQLCTNATDIDDTCRLQKTADFFNCVYDSQDESACSAFKAMIPCFQSSYLPCGCPTAAAFSDAFSQLLGSTACQLTSDPFMCVGSVTTTETKGSRDANDYSPPLQGPPMLHLMGMTFFSLVFNA